MLPIQLSEGQADRYQAALLINDGKLVLMQGFPPYLLILRYIVANICTLLPGDMSESGSLSIAVQERSGRASFA
jgi:hypothetical protein